MMAAMGFDSMYFARFGYQSSACAYTAYVWFYRLDEIEHEQRKNVKEIEVRDKRDYLTVNYQTLYIPISPGQ